MTYEATRVVDQSSLASSMGSGDVAVFSTPSMVALMEHASMSCLADKIDQSMTTVGTMISVSHLAATPLTCKVRAVATITAIDNRKVSFKVEAFDDKELIGSGTHDRVIMYWCLIGYKSPALFRV
eukprot:gene1534-1791_t